MPVVSFFLPLAVGVVRRMVEPTVVSERAVLLLAIGYTPTQFRLPGLARTPRLGSRRRRRCVSPLREPAPKFDRIESHCVLACSFTFSLHVPLPLPIPFGVLIPDPFLPLSLPFLPSPFEVEVPEHPLFVSFFPSAVLC